MKKLNAGLINYNAFRKRWNTINYNCCECINSLIWSAFLAMFWYSLGILSSTRSHGNYAYHALLQISLLSYLWGPLHWNVLECAVHQCIHLTCSTTAAKALWFPSIAFLLTPILQAYKIDKSLLFCLYSTADYSFLLQAGPYLLLPNYHWMMC